ncbi:MAG: LemA family protein [Prevotella sp.]|nr:LemA family protein [Prevotella sp.]
MVLFVILGVIAAVLIALLTGYNGLVRLRNKVNEAFATMDVLLKKRFDLIPSLVEVVKGYARHESDVLQEVTRLRSTASRGAQLKGEVKISDALKGLFVVAEAYPDLKANGNFLKLQDQLVRMEDEISLSRRYYNGSVREYNNRCQLFPMNLIASLFGFKPMPMFSVDSDDERRAVNVNI